jgi:hypothetical protein
MDHSSPATHRIYDTSVASVYVHYVAKAERKGRTRAEIDEITGWLTGYSPAELAGALEAKTTFAEFFANAPRLNPDRDLVTGVICGIRVENMEPGLMREIRILDKLVDEVAKGKAMSKIKREAPAATAP